MLRYITQARVLKKRSPRRHPEQQKAVTSRICKDITSEFIFTTLVYFYRVWPQSLLFSFGIKKGGEKNYTNPI